MAGERRLRILTLLAGDGLPEAKRLCQVGAEVTATSGAGIMVMSGSATKGSVCATDAVSAQVEELQLTLGEGPGLDASWSDRPVLEPDLADPNTQRWLAFSGLALQVGVRAVFSFPLRVGAIRIGALDLYRDRPGPLSDDQHADALVMADVAAQALLVLQANAPAGQLAVGLADLDFHPVVHQASGMAAVQLGVSLGDALARLRAHAFSHDRRLTDVARDVVSRSLRFEPLIDGPEWVPDA